MRRLLALALLASLGAIAFAGCGTNFPLPTETLTGRGYSTDNSYQMVATWQFAGGDTIADILLTQGPGSQLFLLFNHAGIGAGPRGAVYSFAVKARPPAPSPLPGITFQHVFVPAALGASASRVFVLDQGDTALARDPVTHQITDFASYWRVREYGLLGGDTISTFTDTTVAFVRGVAVDAQERIYVAGSAIVLVPDQQDPRILTRLFQFRVNRYLRVSPGSQPPDPFMPGTDRWVRDRNFIVEEGSGLGTLSDPRGLYWIGPGNTGGQGLFAADFGKNWVQKLSDAASSTGLYKIDADSSVSLNGPVDVTADLSGYVYLTDTGNARVLRFDPYGQFVQRVDVEKDSYGQPLVDPIAVAADDSLAFVGDRATNKVIRYLRRR